MTLDRKRAWYKCGGKDGVALMLVLLFVLLLSVIVVEYAYETQVEASLAGNGYDDFQACVAARSAISSGLALLEGDIMQQDIVSSTQGLVNQLTQPTQATTQGAIEDYDSYLDVWYQGVPYQMINEAVMQCTIDDECGKLNLNALFVDEQQTNPILEAALHSLFMLLEVEEDPTDAILDWIDEDDDPRPNGAESDIYASLDPPYMCKNGPMDSIEELLLIVGITPELYFDGNRAPVEAELESGFDDYESVPISLPDLLTVHGHPQGKINVNTARGELLDALFEAWGGSNPGVVDVILARQQEEPFRSVQDLQSVGVGDANQNPNAPAGENAVSVQDIFDVRSEFFRIYGDGQSNDVLVRIETYVYRAANDSRGMVDPNGLVMEPFRILNWKVIR